MRLTEEGLNLRVKNLRSGGEWLRHGTMTWSNRLGAVARMHVRIVEYLEEAEVILNYTANGEPIEQKISCEATVQNGGGYRWWFVCPGCSRRMGVLYLPPAQRVFRCRRCYGLRYRSQQRDLDFLLKPMAAAAGVPRRIARKYLEEAQGILQSV